MATLLPALRDLRQARLLRRAQRGDRDAFRALYRALQPEVYRFVARRLARRPDVEDVVAQVFTSVLEALPRIDPRKGTLFAYVIGCARRAVIDQLRRPDSVPVDALGLVDGSPSALE